MEFAASQRDRKVAAINEADKRQKRGEIANQVADRRACDPEAREPEGPGNQERHQDGGDTDPNTGKDERRAGIPASAQHHHHGDECEDRGNGETGIAHEGQSLRERAVRHLDGHEKIGPCGPAGSRQQRGKSRDETERGADRPLHRMAVAGAEGLADGDTGGGADAHHRAHQHEHEDVRVDHGNQRIRAQGPADPDGRPGTGKRVQDVRRQEGQREDGQRGDDIALDQPPFPRIGFARRHRANIPRVGPRREEFELGPAGCRLITHAGACRRSSSWRRFSSCPSRLSW
nr:hypothetical protein [Pacificimonas aurantium]